jgi:hypothetical protein
MRTHALTSTSDFESLQLNGVLKTARNYLKLPVNFRFDTSQYRNHGSQETALVTSSLCSVNYVIMVLVLFCCYCLTTVEAQYALKSRRTYRGPQVAGTSMSNVLLKSREAVSPSRATYISWRAPRSGRIKEIWGWFKTDNKRDYSEGNRGTYTVSIRPDFGGLPALKVLSEKRKISKFKDNDTSDNLRHIVFKRGAKVVAGRTYHFIIINTDSRPLDNWLSLNTVVASNGFSQVSRPTNVDNRSFGFHSYGGKYESGMPTWVVGIDTNGDGGSDVFSGNPYVGVFSHYESANPWSRPVSGVRLTRVGYPVPAADGGHTVKRVGVAAYRIAGSAPLTVSLIDGNGGILTTAEIQSSEYPLISNPSGVKAMNWGEAAFRPEVPVEPNGDYYLLFRTTEDTVYYPVALQDSADSYGGPENMNGLFGGWFGTSAHAEHSVDGGASWAMYSLTNSKLGSYVDPTRKWDLSFYVVTG